MGDLKTNLDSLSQTITEICQICGIPGVSLGVLHHNEIIHTANYGYRDVENKLPSDENTTYVTGSLSKAFTAAMVAMLVDEGAIKWDTPLREVLPDFHRSETDSARNITIIDLVSHRTGFPRYDSYWLTSNNCIYFDRSQTIPLFNSVPTAKPLRSHFLYNNLCYEILGQVIEKLSNKPFNVFLRDRLTKPLGLDSTYYTNDTPDGVVEAKAYVSLDDGSPFQIPVPLSGTDVFTSPAGGVRSSVRDLLILDKSFIEAANREMGGESESHSGTQNPLKQVLHLWTGAIHVPPLSLQERSYAGGWSRGQLPGVLAPFAGNPTTSPIVGRGKPPRLAIYHGGSVPGYSTYNTLFPETASAVVVLTNSLALSSGVRWICELIVETLFENHENANDYLEIAKISAKKGAEAMLKIKKQLDQSKTHNEPVHPLDTYAGKYYNSTHSFFINIVLSKESNKLYVSYMGNEADTFMLEPYQENSFFWILTHNECAKLARYTLLPKEYYIIQFNYDGVKKEVNSLSWKHEQSLSEGDIFQKEHSTLHFEL